MEDLEDSNIIVGIFQGMSVDAYVFLQSYFFLNTDVFDAENIILANPVINIGNSFFNHSFFDNFILFFSFSEKPLLCVCFYVLFHDGPFL